MRYVSKRYFEYRNGKSNKFWEIMIGRNWYSTKYGKIGTKGRVSNSYQYESQWISRVIPKLIASKIAKGYIEVTGSKPQIVEVPPVEEPKLPSNLNRLVNI